MACARRQIVDPHRGGFYHCVARCVRRAFLCGHDTYSGKNFEHRRAWIRSRLADLIDVFAIEIVGYAVMMNHLHSVLRTRPDIVRGWTDNEVARRWRMLFPKRLVEGKAAEPTDEELFAITSNPELVAKYRERLSCVSWFNRCLNEHIARRANAEDDVTGRFWQGRFRCQRLENDAAVLACSVYVDLNPIRAGIAATPEESDFTSIQDRIRRMLGQVRDEDVLPALTSIRDVCGGRLVDMEYIALVDATSRAVVAGKHSVASSLQPILERLGIVQSHWVETATQFGRLFRRLAGTVADLRRRAEEQGRSWFQGLESARRAFA